MGRAVAAIDSFDEARPELFESHPTPVDSCGGHAFDLTHDQGEHVEPSAHEKGAEVAGQEEGVFLRKREDTGVGVVLDHFGCGETREDLFCVARVETRPFGYLLGRSTLVVSEIGAQAGAVGDGKQPDRRGPRCEPDECLEEGLDSFTIHCTPLLP